MDTIIILPLRHSITATLFIPGSKSYTNRALILGAMIEELPNAKYTTDFGNEI